MTEMPAYEREYVIDGMEERIHLQIFEPKLDKGAWVCERKLTGPMAGFNKPKKIYGEDKLQALSLTLQIIRRITAYIRSFGSTCNGDG